MGACLICTPRAAAVVVTVHFILFLGVMVISYNNLLVDWVPPPEPDDMGNLILAASVEIRRRIYFEQTLRWGIFMGMTVLVCAAWVREIWSREAHLRTREKVLEQKRHLIQMGELTGRIAHGVNTPLGLLSGHLEMLLGETKKGTKLHKRLTELDVFLQRAIGTVRQTLDTNRLSLSQVKPLAIGTALSQVADAVQDKLKPKDGRLILDVEKDLPEVNAYPESFYQAMLNVVENAVDSIPVGGLVTVTADFKYRSVRLSAADRRGEVCVTVRDTGKGIPPEELDRIFEPFYSTKDFGHGTGLGLAIVKRVMEEHRGTVKVESKVGVGTMVVLSLPAEARSGAAPSPGSGV
jgi:signal transduction histidine kinase